MDVVISEVNTAVSLLWIQGGGGVYSVAGDEERKNLNRKEKEGRSILEFTVNMEEDELSSTGEVTVCEV